MSISSKLLKVGGLTHSLSVYVPSMILQKLIGMGRLVILTRLISRSEYALWGIGLMIFTLVGPMLTLGANHSLVRYVSLYEARGELDRFYRRVRWWVLGLSALFTLIIFLQIDNILMLANSLSNFLSAQTATTAEPASFSVMLSIVGNIFLMGIFVCMMALIYGMRLYRLAAVLELFFTISFSAVALIWSRNQPDASAVLNSHFITLAATLVAGIFFCEKAVCKLRDPKIQKEFSHDQQLIVPAEPSEEIPSDLQSSIEPRERFKTPAAVPGTVSPAPGAAQVMRFSLFSMISSLIWSSVGYIAFTMVYLRWGGDHAGPFNAVQRLCQPVIFIANAAWGVLFAHVAKRWEAGNKDGALYILETTYKAISISVMTLAVLLSALSPIWIKILSPDYQFGINYVPGLLMLYMVLCNMSLLTIFCKLHERPVIISLAAVIGGSFICAFAAFWMPMSGEPFWGEVGAARAAGVGMFFGAGVTMLIYLLACKIKLQESTYFIIAMPVFLLVPPVYLTGFWTAFIGVTFFTNFMFSSQQKQTLLNPVRDKIRRLRGRN